VARFKGRGGWDTSIAYRICWTGTMCRCCLWSLFPSIRHCSLFWVECFILTTCRVKRVQSCKDAVTASLTENYHNFFQNLYQPCSPSPPLPPVVTMRSHRTDLQTCTNSPTPLLKATWGCTARICQLVPAPLPLLNITAGFGKSCTNSPFPSHFPFLNQFYRPLE
jgi:hypothetical protein